MPRLNRLVLSVFLSLWLPSAVLAAEPPGGGESESETVLFLTIAEETEASQLEERFLTELRLALDTATVKAISPEGEESFDSLPIDRQVRQITPMLETHDATAAIWLTKREENVYLHVVVISKGRALVRLVEATEETSESHLASAARELASTSHLFECDQAPLSKWEVSVLGTVRGGLGDYIGPSTWTGGTVGIGMRITQGLLARAWLGGIAGPLGSYQGLDASGFALQGGIGAAYLWNFGPVSIGPAVGIQAEWTNVELQAGSGPKERSMEWQFQEFTNLEFRVQLGDSFNLTAGGGLLFTTYQDIYKRESDGITIYSTPFVSWNAFLGMVIYLN